MTEKQFSPGFRCSVFDVVVIVVGAIGSVWAWQNVAWWAGVGVAYIVLHFFLFCNVFRIRRIPELIWAAVFSALAASSIQTSFPDWTVTFGVNALFTAVLIAIETRVPSYHGVFWKQFNPNLPHWWEEQQSAEALNAAD